MAVTVTAYFIIPIYTILFVSGTNWFQTNFSVIGNVAGREEAFVLWGLIVGIYFFYCLRRIIRRMPEPPRFSWLVSLALLLLVFAVTTPYLPETLPLKSFLHIIFAFMASVCLILSLFFILLKLAEKDKASYKPWLAVLGLIVIISAVLLIIVGIISSALEIFFTLSMTLMVYRLYLRICR